MACWENYVTRGSVLCTLFLAVHTEHTLSHMHSTQSYTHAHMHLTGSLAHTPTQLHPHSYTLVLCPPGLCAQCLTQSHSPTLSSMHILLLIHTASHSYTRPSDPCSVSLSHVHKACTRSSLGAHAQHNEGTLTPLPDTPVVSQHCRGLGPAWLLLAHGLQWWRQLWMGFYSSRRRGKGGGMLQMKSEEESHSKGIFTYK